MSPFTTTTMSSISEKLHLIRKVDNNSEASSNYASKQQKSEEPSLVKGRYNS